MKSYKIGVIGTGSRSLAYIKYYVPHEKKVRGNTVEDIRIWANLVR